MIVFLQVVAIWFVVTTVVYLLVVIYVRSLQRERLEKEFDATFPVGSASNSGPEAELIARDRDTYVSEGMATYENGLRYRLIGFIYVLPAVAFVVVYVVVN